MSVNTSTPAAALSPEILSAEIVLAHEEAPLSISLVDAQRRALANRIMELESQGLTLAQELGVLTVTDQETYDVAAVKLTEGKAFVKDATEFFEPFRKITYNVYDMVLARKKGVISAPETEVKALADRIIKFDRQQEQLRQQEQRRLQEEHRQAEEKTRRDAAAAAEQSGAKPEAVQEILTAPITAPAPVAAPTFTRAAGVSTRDNWLAEADGTTENEQREAFWKLVKAAAKDKRLLGFLEPNMVALNREAKSFKTAMQVPGFHAVNKGSVAVRGAR